MQNSHRDAGLSAAGNRPEVAVAAGRYILLDPIGTGKFSTVWRAFDTALNVDVAIKAVELPADHASNERQEKITASVREARAAARLRANPHVVSIYDVVTDGPWQLIVMEYVPGRSLAQAVTAIGPLPNESLERIAVGILDALTATHDAGLLHLDIAPGNILLADDGRVLLADFGLTATLTQAPDPESDMDGTPFYRAPELSPPDAATPAADLYSFGAVLYYATTGQNPPHPKDIAGNLSFRPKGELGLLVADLMDPDPGQRINTRGAHIRLRALHHRGLRRSIFLIVIISAFAASTVTLGIAGFHTGSLAAMASFAEFGRTSTC